MKKKHYVQRSKKRQESKKHKKAKRQRETKKSTSPETLPVRPTSRPEFICFEDWFENLFSEPARQHHQPPATTTTTAVHDARLRMHQHGQLHVSQGPVHVFELPGMSPHPQGQVTTDTPHTGTSEASTARAAQQVAPPLELRIIPGHERARVGESTWTMSAP